MNHVEIRHRRCDSLQPAVTEGHTPLNLSPGQSKFVNLLFCRIKTSIKLKTQFIATQPDMSCKQLAELQVNFLWFKEFSGVHLQNFLGYL
jgi:hypothetical protein